MLHQQIHEYTAFNIPYLIKPCIILSPLQGNLHVLSNK